MASITLPHNWHPRPYQLPVLNYLDSGGRRAVTVWARRHGKDTTAINYAAKAAYQRVGLYWHILPTLRQARKAIWNAINKDGVRLINQAMPEAIRQGEPRDDEMMIRLRNGSIYQCVGADNADALIGSNPIGVIFSEYAVMDQTVWNLIRPILMENGGWAWFVFTPRGKNHAHALYEAAQKSETWFAESVDIEKGGVLDVQAVLKEERESGMPEELIQQEYFCSFDIGNVGSIFGKQLDLAKLDGRITNIPYDPNFPVETVWDLGYRDATAIWFVQRVGFQVRFIDYYESSGEGLSHYINVVRAKPYAYSRHIAPFDIEVRELGTGKSRKEIAEQLGLRFDVAPKLPIEDGLNAARALIQKSFFNEARVADGLKALKHYKREWDDEKKTFRREPTHDWSSHAASAFRYYAVMPELEYMMPQWLKDMSPVFGGRVPANKLWTPEKKDVLGEPIADPLGEWR